MRKLFDTKKIGVCISDKSIEMIEMSFLNGHGLISNYKKVYLEKDLLNHSHIVNKGKIKEILKNIFENGVNGEFGKGEIIFLVQQANQYSFLLPLSISNNINEDIRKYADGKLAEKIENYYFYYKNLNQVESISQRNFAYVSFMKKKFLKEWITLFFEIGRKISYFEPKSLALNRYIENKDSNIVILDIDFSKAEIFIFLDNQIFHSKEINFNKELLSGLSKEDVLNCNLSKKNINSSLMKELLEPLVSELEKTILYVKKKTGRTISHIYLAGSISEMVSIDTYLKNELDQIIVSKFSLLDKSINQKSVFKNNIEINLEDNCENKFYKYDNKNLVKQISNSFSGKTKNMILKIFLFAFLFVILIFSLFFVYDFFNKKGGDLVNIESKYLYNNNFSYNILLATDKIHRKNEVQGRIFEIIFNKPLTKEDILEQAKKTLSSELKEGEFYWEQPLQLISSNDSAAIKTSWFIGDSEQLNIIIESNINDKLTDEKFEILHKKNYPITQSGFDSLFRTKIEIILQHDFDIRDYDLQETNNRRIVIINTSNNKINIRKGPGINFPIIARASEGEVYSYIRTMDSWVNFKLITGEFAWISEKFVNILN